MTERITKYDSPNQTIHIVIHKPPNPDTKWINIPFLIGAGVFGASALQKASNHEYALAAGLAIASINLFTTQYLLTALQDKSRKNQTQTVPAREKIASNGDKYSIDKQDKSKKIPFRSKPTPEEFSSSDDEPPTAKQNKSKRIPIRSKPTPEEFSSSDDEPPTAKQNKNKRTPFQSKSTPEEFSSSDDEPLTPKKSKSSQAHTLPTCSSSDSDGDWILVKKPECIPPRPN